MRVCLVTSILSEEDACSSIGGAGHKLLCKLDQRFRGFVRGDQCVTIIFSFLWHIVYTHTCAPPPHMPTHTHAHQQTYGMRFTFLL